jgi:hypothetical protein
VDLAYNQPIMHVENVTELLGIPYEEVHSITSDLEKQGLVRFISDDELIITEQGIHYVHSKDHTNLSFYKRE